MRLFLKFLNISVGGSLYEILITNLTKLKFQHN